MLSDYEKSILNAHRVNPEEVESFDAGNDSRKVIMKNGDEHTLCEVWTRCMGYLRPVSEFNTGKKSEFYTRKNFVEPEKINDTTNLQDEKMLLAAE